MAETKEKGSPSLSVEDALKMYEEYKSFWSENYKEANIDLKMAAGDPATHWGAAYRARVDNKQLTLVINELPQFIHQVTNDIRQNTPSVETIPDAEGDVETAEIFSDLIRDIEYKSSADEAYDTGAEYAVKCAIGFIRVDHDYCNDDSDEQELKIKKVPDPLSVWIDPASIECDGRDANGGVALEPINKRDFDRLYPGKQFVSFTDPKNKEPKDSIVIAEIFIREFTGKRGKTPLVKRYRFSGADRLAETTFPGDYVPIVPVIGEDVWIDGKRILASLIRQARDPQLRLNHWAVKEQQLLNMAPIAPVMAVEGTLVNERKQWQSPGTETVLEYRTQDLEGNPAPAPTRLNPPPVPTGIINAMEGAKQNIKESLGMYNASIGEKSNETSGIAIQRRQQEGDVATFHFPDNVRRSITQVGRILASAIPIVYDTPRVIQTMNNENQPKLVSVNSQELQEGQKQPYNLTKGKYHIRVTTGASYTTKRQEAADLFGEVIKSNPELLNVIGDLWAKNLDVAGAQAMSERFKKMIPPNLLDEPDQEQNPQVVQLTQALQGAQMQIQQLTQAAESNQGEQQAKIIDAQTKQAEIQIKQGELDLKAQELQLKERELELKAANEVANVDPIKEREMQLKEAEFLHKISTESPEEAEQMPVMDETVEMLQARIEQKKADKLASEQRAQVEAQQQEFLAQQEEQERSERQQTTQAVLETLSAIAHQLNNLSIQVAQPKVVMRDANTGMITGVS